MIITSRAVQDFAFAQAMTPKAETGGFIQYHVVENVIVVDRLHLANTSGQAAFRTINPADINKFLINMYVEHKISPNSLNGIWHSHPDFAAFWSGTDTKDGIEEVLLEPGATLYSLVISRIGDCKARFDEKVSEQRIESEDLKVVWNIPLIYTQPYEQHRKKLQTTSTSGTKQTTGHYSGGGAYGQYTGLHSNQDGVGGAQYPYGRYFKDGYTDTEDILEQLPFNV